MLPSAETCARWKNKKFVRQPHRMIIGFLVSVCVLLCYIFWSIWRSADVRSDSFDISILLRHCKFYRLEGT